VKGAFFALLAALIGLAMVGGGIYGLVDSVSGDDSSKSPATAPVSEFSTRFSTGITPSVGECDQVARRDPRLPHLDGLRLERTGGETGDVQADLICNGDTVVLPMRLTGLRDKGTTSYYAWLYKSRRRAEQVGTLIGSEGRGIGSVTIGPGIDTTKYDSLVITRVKFGETEERPRKIVFRAAL
jgi:hypothetical protein